MLLPNSIHPVDSIYYSASIVIQILQENNNLHLIELFEKIKSVHDLSFASFMLCLDWLYLIDVALVNKKGVVQLCL